MNLCHLERNRFQLNITTIAPNKYFLPSTTFNLGPILSKCPHTSLWAKPFSESNKSCGCSKIAKLAKVGKYTNGGVK